MVKSKSCCLSRLPKEQRCKFLIGPIGSWFMPNTSDIWTRPRLSSVSAHMAKQTGESSIRLKVSEDDQSMDCDSQLGDNNNIIETLSYFIYGSIGCFCYGEIHHHYHNHQQQHLSSSSSYSENPGKYQQGLQSGSTKKPTMSALVTRLVDIKDDNSRVSCVRFLKTSLFPIAMVLTESGTLLFHDCLESENLICYRKAELISKFVEPIVSVECQDDGDQHCSKKTRFNVTQQLNGCLWPDAKNAFLGISLLKEKTNLLMWLKIKDITKTGRKSSQQTITKSDLIESFEKIDLDLDQYSSPICCMESILLDSQTCLIGIAMDDGLITVVRVNFEQGQTKRAIKLARHNDQVCSLSFYAGNAKRFPLGLLASASRNGLVLVWDIANEFYFADYQAASFDVGGPKSRINWFAISFTVPSKDSKQVSLVVSNSESGLTILELPENARSKIRLKENKQARKRKQGSGEQSTILHHALLFNIIYDPITESLMTSSLDGNHILWKCQQQQQHDYTKIQAVNKDTHSSAVTEIRPQFLLPSMPNNSRSHMLRHSPIKEDLLGMALGKAGVKFYKVAENSINNRFDMSPSCGLIARKIAKASLSPTSLSWHPSHEYRVAIGTLEGKVLRADLTPRKATLVEAEQQNLAMAKTRPSASNQPEQSDNLFDVEYQPLGHDIGLEEDNHSFSRQYPKTDGIYSLCWGPNPAFPQEVSCLAIYAIGSISHRLSIYYNNKEGSDKLTNYFDEFPDENSLPEAIGESSEVAWKPSMDLMALGTTTGKIIIAKFQHISTDQHRTDNNGFEDDAMHYTGNDNNLFVKLAVIHGACLGNTHIQCLAWHPSTDKDDARYYWLAASANESPAFVFSVKEALLVADVKERLKIQEDGSEHIGQRETTTNIISTYVHKLDAHIKAITDIAWNPHESDILATSSFDRCAYVWQLIQADGQQSEMSNDSLEPATARIRSKFSARDRLFTLEWSLVDTDLIFTSGHDSTIWAWRPSENPLKDCEQVVAS